MWNENETIEITLKTMRILQWTPKWRIEITTQTKKSESKYKRNIWKLQNHRNKWYEWKLDRRNMKTRWKQENEVNGTQKLARNKWKGMKDNKVSEMKKWERKTQRYESLIDRFLRSPWRIEINHVKAQWDHWNHI